MKINSIDEVNSINDVEKVEESIVEHQQALHKRVDFQKKLEADKKDLVASYRDQLKVVKDEIQHELDVLSALENRKGILITGMN